MVSMYAIERTKLEGSCMELAKGERLIEDEELPKEMLGRFVKLKKDLGEGSIALIELWTPKVYDSVAPGFSFRMVFPKEGKMWGREQLANWYVSYYPGCCGLMLHHNWMVTVPWLHKGIGTFANIFSQWYVHDKGYTRLMATEAILDRPYSEQIFKNLGWKVSGEDFTNKRTGNVVRTFYKDNLDLWNESDAKPRLQNEAS